MIRSRLHMNCNGLKDRANSVARSVLCHARNYRHQTDGNFSIIGAFCIIPILGLMSLAIEVGNFHSVRMQHQSISDSAALGAALHYSLDDNEVNMEMLAKEIALAAGVDTDNVTAILTPSPKGDGRQVIKVSIDKDIPLALAQAVSSTTSLRMHVESYAGLASDPGKNCVMALNGNAVFSSSATLNATGCGVGSTQNLTASTTSSINVDSVNLGGTLSINSLATVTTTPKDNNVHENLSNPVTDPYAGVSEISTAFSKIGRAESPSIPSVPTGVNFNIPNSGNEFFFQGNRIYRSGSTWYAEEGTYNIRTLNVTSLKRLVFNGNSTITLSSNTRVTRGAFLDFGDADIASTGNIIAASTGQLNIGNGRLYANSLASQSDADITIGDGDIDIATNIVVESATSLIIGSGEKKIGDNIDVGSAAAFTTGNGELHVGGRIRVGSDAELNLGILGEAFIDGNLETSSSAVLNFSPGRYFIGGNFGSSSAATLTGTDVSFFIGGDIELNSASGTNLSAPSNDSDPTLDTVLFATRTSGRVLLESSARVTIIGSIYAPNASFEVDSGAEITSAGECTLIVARQVRFSNTAQLDTQCESLSEDFNANGTGTGIGLIG